MSRKSFRVEDCACGAAEPSRGAIRRANAPAGQLATDALANGKRRMRVGFIGLDPIGEAMASRLLEAGHQLRVYDPGRDIPEALQSTGVRVAEGIEDACRWADAVFTILPDDEAAEDVILGSGGVLECLLGQAIHIGSSTVSVECADRIVEAHWDAGKQYVSAPVLIRSGSTAEVQLLVIAGGRDATIFHIGPLLSPIGQLARVSGWPSDANLFQLRANCSGANLFGILDGDIDLSGPHDRWLLASLADLDIETNVETETKGVLQ